MSEEKKKGLFLSGCDRQHWEGMRCSDCGLLFQIDVVTAAEHRSPYKIKCPICSSEEVKIIDHMKYVAAREAHYCPKCDTATIAGTSSFRSCPECDWNGLVEENSK